MLPQVETPYYKMNLPSTGKTISYRPFLVKEEKVLYMALEGEDEKEIADAVIRVVQNCIEDDIDVSSLPSFDLEYIFLKLRCKSVGEVATVGIKHEDDSECKGVTKVPVNLEDIEVNVPSDKKHNVVSLTNSVGVTLKYPSLKDSMDVSSSGDNPINKTFSLMSSCIENVFDESNVFEDFTSEEIGDWLQTLNKDQFAKLLDWFSNVPTVEKTVTYKCEECGEEETTTIKGMMNFFE